MGKSESQLVKIMQYRLNVVRNAVNTYRHLITHNEAFASELAAAIQKHYPLEENLEVVAILEHMPNWIVYPVVMFCGVEIYSTAYTLEDAIAIGIEGFEELSKEDINLLKRDLDTFGTRQPFTVMFTYPRLRDEPALKARLFRVL